MSMSKGAETRTHVLGRIRQAEKNTQGNSRLKGKVGIITGVGPQLGIGTATAWLMAREGAKHLYLLDFVDTHLSTLRDNLQKTFPDTKITLTKGDAASSMMVQSLVDRAMKEEGHLDFFFANAGIIGIKLKDPSKIDPKKAVQQSAKSLSATPEDFMEVMRVNTLSVFLAVKYASEAMAKTCPSKGKTISGGSIILTASVAGKAANAGPIPYSASKAAVISVAQNSAFELTGSNIRVNAICPGLIETDMTKVLFDLAISRGREKDIGQLNPLRRYGLGTEVAQLALFLASDDSSYVNGQALSVDGGLTAGLPFVPSRL